MKITRHGTISVDDSGDAILSGYSLELEEVVTYEDVIEFILMDIIDRMGIPQLHDVNLKQLLFKESM